MGHLWSSPPKRKATVAMQVPGTPAPNNAERDKGIAGADFQHSSRNKVGREIEDDKPCENVQRPSVCVGTGKYIHVCVDTTHTPHSHTEEEIDS